MTSTDFAPRRLVDAVIEPDDVTGLQRSQLCRRDLARSEPDRQGYIEIRHDGTEWG